MTCVISFVNQKGGVGKTTSSLNVSAVLANQGKKVLLVDMDPQGNATQVYSNVTDDDLSVFDLITKTANLSKSEISINDVIQSTYIDSLDILPSNVLLSSAEVDLISVHGRETVLKRMFKEYLTEKLKYDYIIIDSPPSLGLLTINSIVASDYVVVPLKADIFSLKGLELINETVTKLQDIFEIDTTILGMFFTQVFPKEAMFKESFDLCNVNYNERLFGNFITHTNSIDQANAMSQSVTDFDSNSKSSEDYIFVYKRNTIKNI